MIYFISKFYFYFQEIQSSREKNKKVQRYIVIASIVKDISARDFEKSLAKIGHEKGKSVLVHNTYPSYMS